MTGAATLVAALAEQAGARPDRPAVTDDTRSLTYAELSAEVDRLAAVIVERVGREPQPVGILLAPSVDAVVAVYGVLRAGMIAVPLDHASPPSALTTIVEHAGVRAIVTNPQTASLLDGVVEQIAIGEATSLSSTVELPEVSPDRSASIHYTSGSTGRAKGFVISHGAQLRGVRSWTTAYGFEPDDRIALLFHHSFGASRVSLYGALAVGAELRVYDVRRLGIDGVVRALDADSVSVTHCAPSLLRSILSAVPSGANFRALRLLVIGAEGINRRDIERFRRHVWSGCVLAYSYAVSEVGPVAAVMIDADSPVADANPVPVGRPLPGKQVVIADPDDDQVGEILVAGDGLADGYWRDAEQTALRFGAERDESATRFFRTGDRGFLRPDGMLEYRGRLGTLVKVRGYTVDVAEVERTLSAIAPFDDVAVVVLDRLGRGRLVAYVVPDPAAGVIELGKLRALMMDNLPAHMVPSAFVRLDALPRTARGKVDVAALPPVPKLRPDVETPYVAPRDDLERLIASAWADVLEIDRVGVDDDFLLLGGDSLTAAHAASLLQDRLRREVPVGAFVGTSTVAAMAGLLRSDDERLNSSLVVFRAEGARPPLFCVHGGGGNVMMYRPLAERLGDEQPFYGLQLFGSQARRAVGSIERLAAHYVDEVRRVRPHGPYLLAGFSFGGGVVFEMARQLAAAGEPPPVVVLIDTTAPGEVRARTKGKPWKRWAREITYEWKWVTWRLGWARWLAVRRVFPKAAGSTWRIHEKQGGLTNRATLRYRPGPYDGRVVLMRRPRSAFQDRGWAALLTRPVEAIDVPGDHDSILLPPNVDVVAGLLAHTLAEAVASDMN